MSGQLTPESPTEFSRILIDELVYNLIGAVFELLGDGPIDFWCQAVLFSEQVDCIGVIVGRIVDALRGLF